MCLQTVTTCGRNYQWPTWITAKKYFLKLYPNAKSWRYKQNLALFYAQASTLVWKLNRRGKEGITPCLPSCKGAEHQRFSCLNTTGAKGSCQCWAPPENQTICMFPYVYPIKINIVCCRWRSWFWKLIKYTPLIRITINCHV